VKRRKRDIYGNWIWEDEKEIHTSDENESIREPSKAPPPKYEEEKENEELKLDWRDFVALSIASLETFLLPIVVFILILLGIVIGLSFLR
jgi:hypothetical protein